MEVKGGEGGEDSKLFAHDLGAAYVKYASRLGFTTEILDTDESSITLGIRGNNVWSSFEGEIGKHCVQRVPPTEKRGRRQTSTVVVLVTNLASHNSDPRMVNVAELEISTMRGSGPGGQHKQKTESCVRIRHKPTGITVRIDGRDQSRNKEKAIQIITQKVKDHETEISDNAAKSKRKEAWKGGTRSEKIRTYNFIDNRAVDHRTGIKTKNVAEVIGKGKFELLK